MSPRLPRRLLGEDGRRRQERARPGSRARFHFLPIALVLVVAGVLAAAGSGLEDESAPAVEGGGPPKGAEDAGPTLTIAWSERPSSLDPALASGRTAQNLIWNLMDPLVRLGGDLEPVPGLAEGWNVSRDGLRVTFTLRPDGRWSNGDRVTAADFEFAWKRVLDPATRSPHASRLFGVRGARAYHDCLPSRCVALRSAVGISAPSDRKLVVDLVRPRPWFPAEVADPAFVAVHRGTVQRLPSRWARPDTIVTDGSFRLERLDDSSVVLVRDDRWRAASRVAVARVEGRFIPDARARVRAFDAGQVMALDGSALPADELPALRERREYNLYPGLGTAAYAFNLDAVPDVHQRRAMALAINRRAIAENVIQADVVPATRLLPPALPTYTSAPPDSPWLPAQGDLARARAELARAATVERDVTLLHVDARGNGALAVAVGDAWRRIGLQTSIRARPAADFLDFAGPLSSDSVDVYQADVRFSYPEAMAGLAPWRCNAAGNKSNFCRETFDALLARARDERSPVRRSRLYARAENLVSGSEGALAAIPLYWRTFANLEALSVAPSFAIDPLGRIDLAAVDVRKR